MTAAQLTGHCTTGNHDIHQSNQNLCSIHMSSVFPSSLTVEYLLCRLPEVSWVGQSAVEFGQLLQHVSQLGEGGPVSQVIRPAGREDLLEQDILCFNDFATYLFL